MKGKPIPHVYGVCDDLPVRVRYLGLQPNRIGFRPAKIIVVRQHELDGSFAFVSESAADVQVIAFLVDAGPPRGAVYGKRNIFRGVGDLRRGAKDGRG